MVGLLGLRNYRSARVPSNSEPGHRKTAWVTFISFLGFVGAQSPGAQDVVV
jgi:hypothetical protein